jgi:hypothetical protein
VVFNIKHDVSETGSAFVFWCVPQSKESTLRGPLDTADLNDWIPEINEHYKETCEGVDKIRLTQDKGPVL